MEEEVKRYSLEKKDKRHRRQKDEEHITLLSEPGSQYLGHLTPPSGHDEEIAALLFLFLARTKSLSIFMRGHLCASGLRASLAERLRSLQLTQCMLAKGDGPLPVDYARQLNGRAFIIGVAVGKTSVLSEAGD
ncbi:hypothetical protein AVEN_128516-1 [Araneus ventricosus]|uniref:Uncharacterized protein n=1 Tax=Araneus ventricosus TaxID=182803 RepID=A0A4Y2HNY5_ARAVE|nr:hypothetical protein AVEN_128516-1 [Araneus ventricosus]